MRIEMLQDRQGGRRCRPHAEIGRQKPGQRIAFSGFSAEINEVIPEKKERRADPDAARRDRPDRESGVIFQPVVRRGNQEIIQARSG